MAQDVFNRNSQFGDSMSADATRMTFQGALNESAGLILQAVDITYQQNISRLYALESGKIYFVAGQTQGGLGVSHVVGPAGIQKAFYQAYGDVCKVEGGFQIDMAAGCGSASSYAGSVTLSHPIISQINLKVEASSMIIFSGFQATFVGMLL